MVAHGSFNLHCLFFFSLPKNIEGHFSFSILECLGGSGLSHSYKMAVGALAVTLNCRQKEEQKIQVLKSCIC